MMHCYLSRLRLATRRRDAHADLLDCCRLHARLLSAFAPVTEGAAARVAHGVLYRVEDRARGILLVQSRTAPDWSRLPPGYLLEAQMKAVTLALTEGQPVLFRLVGNAVKSVRCPQTRGKRYALLTAAEQEAWLRRQAEAAGLEVQQVSIQPEPLVTGWHRTERRVMVHAVRYDGRALVRDAGKVQGALEQGLGHGKAYGCGLLSVARVAI